ncbi:methyltransferase domain-containing protein [Kitasatospora sp. DSM 101779]|uniref:methyltransferase domain-containing protein n=1 Tax=Kitasatospora sp. DSM 101779 TaxID=2853165 RepID=UPI003986E5C4
MPGHVVRGDAARLPLAPGRADAVVLVRLLHLLPDAEPVLAEAARVLRPGGVVHGLATGHRGRSHPRATAEGPDRAAALCRDLAALPTREPPVRSPATACRPSNAAGPRRPCVGESRRGRTASTSRLRRRAAGPPRPSRLRPSGRAGAPRRRRGR